MGRPIMPQTMHVLALGLGTVSVVAPLYGTAPIFLLFLAPFFLRDVETFSLRSEGSADDAPAHHADRVAGDVARGVGGEEDAGIRDVVGPTEAPDAESSRALPGSPAAP